VSAKLICVFCLLGIASDRKFRSQKENILTQLLPKVAIKKGKEKAQEERKARELK
jgi:hypothetical protein